MRTVVGGLDEEGPPPEWAPASVAVNADQDRGACLTKWLLGAPTAGRLASRADNESTALSSLQDQHDGTSMLDVATVPIKPRTTPCPLLEHQATIL